MTQNDRKTIRSQFIGGLPGHVRDADYFYFDAHSPADDGLGIVCGGHEFCAADFELRRTNYPYWFVIYTVAGQGEVNTQGHTQTLQAGTLSGMAPGTSHHYSCDPARPMEQYFATFCGPDAGVLFAISGLNQHHALHMSEAPLCLELFEDFMQTGLDHALHAQTICGAYLKIILMKAAAELTGTSLSYSGAMLTFQDCRRYINRHYQKIKGPGEVAQACQVDVRYLAALFKRFSTVSPYQYLMRLKLNRAADLLLTTSLSVKEIATYVGFEDPYHFSRNFKQFHTCSPKQYRLNHL